jgi:hypothetical protein
VVNLFIDIIVILILYLFIAFVWTIVEKALYGQITPRLLDDVVAIILAISLYLNLK